MFGFWDFGHCMSSAVPHSGTKGEELFEVWDLVFSPINS